MIDRKKISWLMNVNQWNGLNAEELFHAAEDREGYKEIVNMAVVGFPDENDTRSSSRRRRRRGGGKYLR